MALFVHIEDFKKLNIGFSLDEGLASETDTYSVYFAERSIWRKRLFMTSCSDKIK